MDRCVAGYADDVRAGATYLYRVLRPERATLQLARRGSELAIVQFKLARNGNPSPESWLAVQQWLRERSEGAVAAGPT